MTTNDKFRCEDCIYHEDKSYYFDEYDADHGWKCTNPKSEFNGMYFYPTDSDYWDEWHDKLQKCNEMTTSFTHVVDE